jgi:hypothetical protein
MTYRCERCGHEEEVAGRADDGPIIERSKVLGVTVQYVSSQVKNMAEAEIRHVMKMHGGKDSENKNPRDIYVEFSGRVIAFPNEKEARSALKEGTVMNTKVTFYGIEAELPPGTDHPLMVEDGEALICSAQFGNSAYRCISHTMREVFAATAVMRWHKICRNMERPENIGLLPVDYFHAVEQYKLWSKIHEKSIEGQNKK